MLPASTETSTEVAQEISRLRRLLRTDIRFASLIENPMRNSHIPPPPPHTAFLSNSPLRLGTLTPPLPTTSGGTQTEFSSHPITLFSRTNGACGLGSTAVGSPERRSVPHRLVLQRFHDEIPPNEDSKSSSSNTLPEATCCTTIPQPRQQTTSPSTSQRQGVSGGAPLRLGGCAVVSSTTTAQLQAEQGTVPFYIVGDIPLSESVVLSEQSATPNSQLAHPRPESRSSLRRISALASATSSPSAETMHKVPQLASSSKARDDFFSAVREVMALQSALAHTREELAEAKGLPISKLAEAMALRKKWMEPPTFSPFTGPNDTAAIRLNRGLFSLVLEPEALPLLQARPMSDFLADYRRLLSIAADPAVKKRSRMRLHVLEKEFQQYRAANGIEEQKLAEMDRQDFYGTRKVDTHIHAAAAMSARHLVQFIKRAYALYPSEVVTSDGRTLKQLVDAVVDIETLNVDQLACQATEMFMGRFDLFNVSYNILGKRELRQAFLKPINSNGGRFFAEIIKEVFRRIEGQNVNLELRISVSGTEPGEWDKLAYWHQHHNMRHPQNRWLIQVPRTFSTDRQQGFVESFETILKNLFQPLLEVTLTPDSHPHLARFLEDVSGFDSVNDESLPDMELVDVPPGQWCHTGDPPYAYWCYYLSANLGIVNALRVAKGLNCFSFRPHCGETGSTDHLAAAFLIADGIGHGVNLAKAPSLQYLYYLAQVGLAISPSSNNALFLLYEDNPFFSLFARGLNVSLGTDDPLQFHLSDQPLMEEYAIARAVWKLSVVDLAELARNSVLQSGFAAPEKAQWLGPQYTKEGTAGNDIDFTNIPNGRVKFRYDSHQRELAGIED